MFFFHDTVLYKYEKYGILLFIIFREVLYGAEVLV